MAKPPILIVYDWETGGFGKDVGMVEIAMVAFDFTTRTIVGEYESIIKPYKDDLEKAYTSGAAAVHGISLDMQRDEGKDAKTVAEEMNNFIKKHTVKGFNGKPIIGGHNIIKFDNPRTERFLAEFKIDFNKLINNQVYDTMFMAAQCFPELPNHKLVTCCERIGVQIHDAHRAMGDVKPNLELLKYILSPSGTTEIVHEERARDSYKF